MATHRTLLCRRKLPRASSISPAFRQSFHFAVGLQFDGSFYDKGTGKCTANDPKVIEAFTWMKTYAEKNGFVYLDYYTPMLDDKGMLKKELTFDGLHPNDAGYEVMGPLAEKAIAQALK